MSNENKSLIQKALYIVPIALWGFSMSSLAVRTWKNSVSDDLFLRILVATIANNGLIGIYYFALSAFAKVKKRYAVVAFLICTVFTIVTFY